MSTVQNSYTVDVVCDNLPDNNPQWPNRAQIPVNAGETVGQLLEACRKAFRLDAFEGAEPRLLFCSQQDVWKEADDLKREAGTLPLQPAGFFRVKLDVILDVCLWTQERKDGEEPRVRKIEGKRRFGLAQPLTVRDLWTGLLESFQNEKAVSATPDYRFVTLTIVDKDGKERPLAIAPNLLGMDQEWNLQSVQVRAGERLVLTPSVLLTLQTSPTFGERPPFPVPITETWGSFRQNMLRPPLGQAFQKISRAAELRIGTRWIEADMRPVGEDIDGEGEVWLHPIMQCAIVTVLNGQIRPFLAQLPADIAVEELMPDLKRQVEIGLGAPGAGWTGWTGGELQLVSYVPPTDFAQGLPEGRLGLGPRQTLIDAGAREGWAILLLVEKNVLPNIIAPVRPDPVAVVQAAASTAGASPHPTLLSADGA